MKPEFDEVMEDPLFSHIMVIKKNNLKFSARLASAFRIARKDEKKEERADHIVDMIQRKHDWSNHVWGVKKVTSSEFEEADKEEEEDQTPDTEIGENSHVAENVDGTIDVSGRNKRKHADRGAESRKKKKFSQQFSDRIDKFETVVTDRLEKIEAEVTLLRTTVLTTELVGKSDQRSGPSKRKIDTTPSTSKKDTAPSKKKVTTKRQR
ncbi:hypothetical protein DY000_02034508 [Brassica cretica]|uniref:Uncharacterized protein n=1 Tax=Brassica cretica TaxID=69181 RepID=A0ABQ7DV80_BRACR|nr:hypothetical protein DY000_02034508 [Brassica cretica]